MLSTLSWADGDPRYVMVCQNPTRFGMFENYQLGQLEYVMVFYARQYLRVWKLEKQIHHIISSSAAWRASQVANPSGPWQRQYGRRVLCPDRPPDKRRRRANKTTSLKGFLVTETIRFWRFSGFKRENLQENMGFISNCRSFQSIFLSSKSGRGTQPLQGPWVQLFLRGAKRQAEYRHYRTKTRRNSKKPIFTKACLLLISVKINPADQDTWDKKVESCAMFSGLRALSPAHLALLISWIQPFQ